MPAGGGGCRSAAVESLIETFQPSGHLAPGFVAYADKKSMVVGENGTWQTGRNKFLKAADPITKWAAITFTQARAEDWQ